MNSVHQQTMLVTDGSHIEQQYGTYTDLIDIQTKSFRARCEEINGMTIKHRLRLDSKDF